jgi:hypothetical protein
MRVDDLSSGCSSENVSIYRRSKNRCLNFVSSPFGLTPLIVLLCLVLGFSAVSTAAPKEEFLLFNGVDSSVAVSDAGSLDISTSITLEAWIQPITISSTKAQDRVLSKDSNYSLTISTGDTGCDFGTSGDVQWRATIGGIDDRICGGSLTLDQWHHVAGTYDGATFILYLDGVPVASAARTGAIATNSLDLVIGNSPTLGRPFDGGIDDVRIWNIARTAGQIMDNMNVELTGAESGLVAYYSFNEGGGQIAADSTVNGNDGILGTTAGPDTNDPVWQSSSNAAPQVDAGLPQTIRLPVNQVDLDGLVTDDGLPSGSLTTTWSVEPGAPGTVTFGDVNAVDTTAGFSAAGVYELRLEAFDGELGDFDTVTITVQQASFLSQIIVTPDPAIVQVDQSQQFTAVGLDQYGDPIGLTPVWTTDGGGINTTSGLYTAPSAPGIFTVTATEGVINGTATVNVQVTAGAAVFLDFDGTDDEVVIPDSASLDISAAITVEAWIKPDSIPDTSGNARVVSKGTTAWEISVLTNDTGCVAGTSGDVQWRATIGASGDDRICGGTLIPGHWHHVAGTYDGSAFILYLDGDEVANVARSGSVAVNDLDLVIGNSPQFARPFDGAIDEVRIWNVARTQQQIMDAMDIELTGTETGLAAYYRFNDATGQTVGDATDNNNTGALGTQPDDDSSDPVWLISGPPVNQAPQVDAGIDQIVRLPALATLNGTVTDDGLPGAGVTTSWSQVSGPGIASFIDAGAEDTSAGFSAAGVYVLRLTADDGERFGTEKIQVTVEPPPVLTTIAVTPNPGTVAVDASLQFTAAGLDQYGDPISVNPSWTTSGGSIDSSGLYTASTTAGTYTVLASDGTVNGQATVNVQAVDETVVYTLSSMVPTTWSRFLMT